MRIHILPYSLSMKKLYATIITSLFGLSALTAQNAPSFAFVHNGEVIPNGSTITLTELDPMYAAAGLNYYHAVINVKNVSSEACDLTLLCIGKDNYNDIAFCYNGSCLTWGSKDELSTVYNTIASGAMAESEEKVAESFHAMTMDDKAMTCELRACNTFDYDDCATLTVIFDMHGTPGVQSLTGIKAERNVEVFNLCGKMIARSTAGLAKGVYIVRQGNTSRKVTIR